MPDTPIGQQVIQNGGFPRTAQEIFNAPSLFSTPNVGTGGAVSLDAVEAKQSLNGPTSLSNVSPLQPGQIDTSGRYPRQVIGGDNEDLYAKGQSWGSKLWNDTKKMVGIASATFAENTLGLIDGLGEWASTGDVSKLWDNALNKSLNSWTAGLENSSPNYYSKAERDAPFFSTDNLLTPNFWFDKVMKNLGFSAGAMAGGMAWGTILNGIGLTSNLAKAGTNMVELANNMEKAIETVPLAERSFSALQFLKDATSPLLKSGQAFNTVDKANRIVTAALGTFGEASIEAMNNSNQYIQEVSQKFKEQNGYDPTGTDLDKIKEEAKHVGNWSMGLNTILLTGTNYIQFPKILNMSSKAEKSLLINGIETQGLKQSAEGIVESALPKVGFAKKLVQAKNIAGLFFNPTEAFEEGAQNVIQEGSIDYFKKQYYNNPNDQPSLLKSLGYATGETLSSKSGLENILIGGLSGALQTSGIIPVSHLLGGESSIKERGFTGYGGEKAKATQEAIQILNDPKNSFGKSLKDNVDSYNRAQVLQTQREAAIRQGDLLETKDLERDYQFNYLMPRIKYGKLDFVLGDIERYKQLSSNPEGFQELQREGYANPTDTQPQFLERLNNFEAHAKAVQESYDYLTNKYGTNRNFTPEVIDRMTYNMSKIKNYDERITQLSTELAKKQVPVQDILNEIHKGSPKKESVQLALDAIEELPDVQPIKDDLKQQLQDVTELALRRNDYRNKYNQVAKNPTEYQNVPTEELQSNIAPIKQRDEEGKSKLFNAEVGKEYNVENEGIFRDGNKLSYNPKLTILSKTLEGGYQVKLPDGTITYLKPTDLKDYKLTDKDSSSPEMEAAINKAVDTTLYTDKYKELKPAFSGTQNLQDKLNILNSLNNKPLIDAVQKEVKNQAKDIIKLQEEKRKQLEKLQNDQKLRETFFSTRKSLEQNDTPIDNDDIKEDEEELRKIDIVTIPNASTEPQYQSTSEHNNAHRRHQEFLLNLNKDSKLQKLHEEGKIQILPVTSKTEEQLGLKGIINPQFKDTSIRYVYVNEEGKPIDGKGNPSTNLDEIIFTNAREADLSYSDKNGVRQPSYTNKIGLDDTQIEEVETQWDIFRKLMLNADINPQNAIDNTFRFDISRGIPNVVNSSTKNSILDINLITEKDLAHPLITIPAINTGAKTIEVPINNSPLKANMPLGKPLFNYNGNMFFLNNRNFTKSEAKSLSELLVLASENLLKDGTIESKLKNYLESVIRFSPTPARNTIHFDDNFNLFLGDKGNGIAISDIKDSKDAIATLLENEVYHHISLQHLNEFKKNPGKTPYTELQSEGDKVTEVEHPSYQSYLLTGKEPVLSTNIAIPQAGELPIQQKYAILHFDNVDIANIVSKKKAETTTEAPKKITSITQIKASSLIDSLNKGLTNIGKPKTAQELLAAKQNKQVPIEDKKADIERRRQEEVQTVSKGYRGKYFSGEETRTLRGDSKEEAVDAVNEKYDVELATLEIKSEEVKPTTVQDILAAKKKKFGGGTFNEPQTRLVGNTFNFIGNTEKEIEDIRKMLPNVDFKMLTSLYQTTGGLKAWGYALPKLIAVYEGAPFGVAYHEAFEQVFNWVLSPEQQLDLYREFTQRDGTFKTFQGQYKTFKAASFPEAKEQMADEFAEFKGTGKVPFPKKNTSNFFRKLWELIKSIFNNATNLEGVFSKLSKGGYANSTIQVQGNTEKQFKREVTDTPEALFQDTINGFTAELFMKKWSYDASLIAQLEDNNLEDTKPLFDQLYAGLEKFYTQEGDNTLDAYYSQLVQDNPKMEDQYLQEYEQVQHLWENVKGQWGKYMEDLKSFLKVFDVAFTHDENGDIQLASTLNEENEKLGGADGYNSESRMHVNAKNSASKAVKLLFATVADSQFVKQVTKDELGRITEKYTGQLATNRGENQMKMPNLAPYAKLFNYTLHNSANTNGIRNIYNNLRALTLKKNIGINANLTRLLNRLGYNGSFSGMSKESIKLVLKMENALSKTKPLFFKQYIHPKEGLINQTSNISGRAEQISDEWINEIKASKFVKVDKDQIKFRSSVLDANNFTFLSNLGISFTQSDYNNLNKGDQNKFNDQLAYIKAEVKTYTTKYIPTSGPLAFQSRLNTLAELYTNNIEGDSTESQHANLSGEAYPNFILPNYVSFIINDLNASRTKEEFLELNPQFEDLYMGSSYLLNNVLFDKEGKRTNAQINTALSEGIYSSNGTIIPHDKMTYSSRLLSEINNNLNGISTALIPADAKTPWGLSMGNPIPKSFFIDKEKAISQYTDIMWEALLNEVSLAKDFENRKHLLYLNQKADNREVGKSLRFFKGILSKALVERINEKLIDNKEELTEEETSKFKDKFKEDLSLFVNKQADKTIINLEGYKLIQKNKRGEFTLYGIDKNFLQSIIGKAKSMKEETMKDIFFYREANYILNNIELHKFLFNDPAQYKDEVKRIKSFESGREYTHSDPKSDLNDALDKHYNKSGDYELQPSDWGYKKHNNDFNAVTVKTVKVPSEEDYGYKPYKNNDIADAQSWALNTTYVEMLTKSGARLTSKQEDLHQWLMAYERNKLLEKGEIGDSQYPTELQSADNKLLKKDIPEATMQILKPIISGVRMDNEVANQFLYKTSTAPLYYYFIEGTPMEKIYLSAVYSNTHFLAMDSAHKVGQTDANTISWEDLDKGEISEENTVPIPYKYFGIQVETSGTKDKVTQGSQLTKLATSGLISNGEAINEEAKVLLERHKNALINLTLERSKALLNKLDIKQGQFGFSIEDKRKVAQFILDEVTRRELPDNIAIGISTNQDNQFTTPLEANVNYKKIKEILYSTIENNILKPKVNGGAKILLSSLGYDTSIVNGKEVPTSRKYKFYQDKDGKYTCQIGIPFIFSTKILKQIQKSQGIEFSSQKEGFKYVLDYLNTTEEGKNLLRGIGFRIPTQGLNSVDHFEIVEFLPPQMGDTVIFPAEITTKAGSDFDVDKMNIYLKNHYIDQNGYPHIIPFHGYNEQAEKEISKLSLSALLSQPVKANEDALDNTNPETEEDNSFYIKSLENEYFNVLGDIISMKETRPLLLKPNNAEQLKAISQKVSPDTEKVGDYTNFIDSDYMFKKRQLFLAMKSAVGIAAVSNTNLALNQFTNLVITPKVTSFVNQLQRNYKLRFKHNQQGENGINLSSLKNTSDDFISDLGSQIIDGTVDVAKSEWLPKMLGDANNLNTLLFMYKAGVDPYSAALYLHQPAIQEYLKRVDISNNTSLFNPTIKKQYGGTIKNAMIKEVASSQSKMKEFFSSKPDRYTIKDMEAFLDTPYESLTKEQKYLQLQMLDDFFMTKQLAQDLFTVVNGYNFDTTRFQNPEAVAQKQLDLQQSLELKNVQGQKDLLTKTHLATTAESVMNTSNGLSTIFSTQKGEAKRILNEFSLQIRTQFFKKDDRVKFTQMGEQSLIDFTINTQGQIANIPVENTAKGEFFGKQTIADWVKQMQQLPSLSSNPILHNIEAVIDKREGYNSYLKLIEPDYDSFTANIWTAAFRELRDSGEIVELDGKAKTVSNLFQHILISQFLQNGTSKSSKSFLHLLPTEEFSKIASPVLQNINSDGDFWMREGLFYRNNYQNNQLVEEAPKEYYEIETDQGRESGYALSKLQSTTVKEALEKAGYSSEILTLPSFGNANKPFVKSTTYIYDEQGNLSKKDIKLYKRVDKSLNEYVTIGKGFTEKVLFKQVNKLGNDNLKEYYSTNVKSILAENQAFNEVTDRELYTILNEAELNPQSKRTTDLISSDEYDLSLEEPEEGKESVNLKPGNCK